jgi:hypothetical protein
MKDLTFLKIAAGMKEKSREGQQILTVLQLYWRAAWREAGAEGMGSNKKGRVGAEGGVCWC